MKIVVVGAGIVGASSAHYLANHPNFDPEKDEIIIIEAVHPACAASGKAGGLLSATAFPKQIAGMSYKLHAELAREFDGEKNWGYRNVTTCSVEATLDQSKGQNQARVPSDLDWINREFITYCEVLGGPDQFSQLHPFYFTNFLVKRLQDQGRCRLITGRVNQIYGSKSSGATGLSYIDKSGNSVRVDADKILVTTGPWTSKLIETCPIYSMKVQSITIDPVRPVSAYALFTELQIDRYKRASPEIYARKDEIYICGESTSVPLPISADLIDASQEAASALFEYGATFAPNVIKGGKLTAVQACYLPIVEDSSPCPGPFLGETNVSNFYIAAGHSCWGINNAPATGKIMAEIILEGEAKSANVKPFNPADYFDASSVLSP